jgi:hypothetical protein
MSGSRPKDLGWFGINNHKGSKESLNHKESLDYDIET